MADVLPVAATPPMSDDALPVSSHAPPGSPEPKRAEDKGGLRDLTNENDDDDSAMLARLAKTARRFGGSLARASTPTYLRRKLATSEGTDEVYANLQREVASPGFLARLRSGTSACNSQNAQNDDDDDYDETEALVFDSEEALRVDAPDSQLRVDDHTNDDSAEYVFVETEDVISAIAEFVAAYVTSHPAASSASPQALQKALGVALSELRGNDRSKVRRVWDYGVGVYRGASWTYATLSTFTNPWIARLIVCAVYTGARLSLGAVGVAAAAVVG